MDERTVENLLIAFAAGITTFVVTFATFQYIRPSIKSMVKINKKR